MMRMLYDRPTRSWRPGLVCCHCNEEVKQDGRLAWQVDANQQPTTGEVVVVHAGCLFDYAGPQGGEDRWQNEPLGRIGELVGSR